MVQKSMVCIVSLLMIFDINAAASVQQPPHVQVTREDLQEQLIELCKTSLEKHKRRDHVCAERCSVDPQSAWFSARGNYPSCLGDTALHGHICSLNPRTVAYLLRGNGVDSDIAALNTDGRTPVRLAILLQRELQALSENHDSRFLNCSAESVAYVTQTLAQIREMLNEKRARVSTSAQSVTSNKDY